MSNKIFAKIKGFFKSLDEVYRDKAVEVVEYETREVENIFALLVLGSFVGLPSPPLQITLELMPYMEHEFGIMLE